MWEPIQFLLHSLIIGVVLIPSMTLVSSFPEDTTAIQLADGFEFLEGPLWIDDVGLIFSDIPADKIYLWTQKSGISVYLDPSGNSNGLTLDRERRLVLTQMGHRRVARRDADGSLTVLADNFGGRKLNSPNDLVVKSDGSVFFTDPPFNIPRGERQELPFSGIFRIAPSGNLQLLDSTLALPNGICFSTDETKLYVNNSRERVIYVWDVIDDSTIANKRAFASVTPEGYLDGMKIDEEGNIYCTGPTGILVFAPNGELLRTIPVPGQTTNCAWGDADRKSLYITSGGGLYRTRTTIPGHIRRE
jgi:gluconolactonase